MTILKERYITAVLGHTPDRQRDEVRGEIRAAIDEIVEQRLDAGEPEDVAIRQALSELGDPAKLASSYHDRPTYLIGPGWYPSYIKTLKVVPGIALPIVAVVSLLADIADGESVLSALSGTVGAIVWAAAWIIFWVTFGFVIAERSQGPNGPEASAAPWTPDDLPETSGPQQIGLWSTIGSIAILLVFGGVVFIQDRNGIGTLVRGVSENLQDTAFVNPDIPAEWSWAFYGLILLSTVAAIIRYRGRVWSAGALLLVALETVAWSAFMVALAMSEPIFNPELGERIDAGADWWLVGQEANSIIALVVILPTLFELWDGWQGYRKRDRTERA